MHNILQDMKQVIEESDNDIDTSNIDIDINSSFSDSYNAQKDIGDSHPQYLYTTLCPITKLRVVPVDCLYGSEIIVRTTNEIANHVIHILNSKHKERKVEFDRFYRKDKWLIEVVENNDGSMVLSDLDPKTLSSIINEEVAFHGLTKAKGELKLRLETGIRKNVIETVYEKLRKSDLKKLQAISNYPFYIKNKETGLPELKTEGYIEETKTLINPNFHIKYKKIGLKEAKKVLDDVFQDFAYDEKHSDKTSYSITIAQMCSILLRDYFNRSIPFPLFITIGSAPGSGKSYETETILSTLTGLPAIASNFPETKKDFELSYLSILNSGFRLIYYDNCNKDDLDFKPLATAVTGPQITGRKYYTQENLTLDNNTIICINGNNTEYPQEIIDRAVIKRINRPIRAYNESYKHPDLIEYVFENRDKIISALLSIIDGWIDQGCPEGPTAHGRMTTWSKSISGILSQDELQPLGNHFISLYDPNQIEVSEADSESVMWVELFETIEATLGQKAFTGWNVKDIFHLASFRDPRPHKSEYFDNDRNILGSIIEGHKDGNRKIALGWILRRHTNKKYGNYILRKIKKAKNGQPSTYKLEQNQVTLTG